MQHPPDEVVVPLMKPSNSLPDTTVLSFDNISYQIRTRGTKRKTLLNGVSGSFHSGRLTAILGPSGAGKSSLLNVLSGFRIDGVDGQILVNNEALGRNRYRQLVAYNTQNAALLPNITVRETLKYAADLKLPTSVTAREKSETVEEIIKLLGLRKCADNQARVLSGGERKRLSIGEDLVANPKIMFFDEPTSGLDSESSYQVISHMKALAKQGRCVISVIHQPSSDLLELFDDIYLVADGSCLYRGSLQNMIPTFAEEGFVCPQYFNRADFAIKVASQATTDSDIMLKLRKQIDSLPIVGKNIDQIPNANNKRENIDRKHTQYPITQWRQFIILTRRTALGTVRNFVLSVLRFLGHVVFGFVVGSIYYNTGDDGAYAISNISMLMVVMQFIVFANAMTVILVYPLEMAVFVREYKSNCYSTIAYFFSKIIADFPPMLVGVTIFQLLVYYFSGQPLEPTRIAMFWFMCFFLGWFSQVFGMVGGSVFPIDVCPFMVPVTLIPLILFCGFFIRFDELPLIYRPLTFLSPFRYAFEGLSLALYGDGREDLGCSEIFCYYKKPKKLLEMLDMEASIFWIDVAGITFIVLVLHVFLFISLRCKVR